MDEMSEQREQSPTRSNDAKSRAKKTGGQMWNLWHGCHKKSEGCQHCYVYRRDAELEKDSNIVMKTANFNLPIRRDRQGNWKVPSGTLLWTCFTSDFFIEDADAWREDAWLMIRRRSDLRFFMITKRPERVVQCLPDDWGEGYENVTICCTMENQQRADERLPIYLKLPIRHKQIICEPLLGPIDFHGRLAALAYAAIPDVPSPTRSLSPINGHGSWCEQVTVGGESGQDARVCDFDWVLNIREQCINSNVSFHFKQTGAHFRKDGRLYNIPRYQQMAQAHKAGIDFK